VTDEDRGSELQEADEPQLGPDDLEHYTGEWVAMRHGRVVAHDPDSEQLRLNPDVLETDDIFPVGEPPSGFYLINV
jgi:Family of unknown function (DUF5678)